MKTASVLAQSRDYLLSGLAGVLIAVGVQEFFEGGREQRENLQTFVTLFHDSHIGGHKDRVLGFMLERDTQARLRATEDNKSYATALLALVDSRPEVSVSLIALTEFFRATVRCAEERRCDKERTLEAFRPYVNDFYPIFYPVLRRMDCHYGTDDAEDSVLKVYSGPPVDSTRCELVAGA